MNGYPLPLGTVREQLDRGLAIPACPLALNAQRKLDERRQRALFRYYLAAGAGGLAVGVHTTQFQIRDPAIGLFKPILELAREELIQAERGSLPEPPPPAPSQRPARGTVPLVRIAGICGATNQAAAEASLLRELEYDAGLLSLGAQKNSDETAVLAHCRAVAEVIPLIGFYLQPSVGGRLLPFSFWRGFCEIPNVIAIKIAPFNRYQTLDVIRAVVEAGRLDIALYTGNDDAIVLDLLTPFFFRRGKEIIERHIVGGLLGHWSVWTKRAVMLLAECQNLARNHRPVSAELLTRAAEITDANAAFFDAAHGYAGCIAGLHEVLRRQGLLAGIWCLDPNETLSPGQREEIDRVYAAYPHLNDDLFVREHLERWLAG